MPKQHTILFGLRGSGKTTIARRIDTAAIDIDDITPLLLGSHTCAEAIQTHGIKEFRDAETRALRGVLASPPAVIALGGGTPTAPGAADLLRRAHAHRVYLRATPATLAERLQTTDLTTRPSLTGQGVIDEIQQLFDERDPLYRDLATHTITIDGLSIEDTVAAIRKALHN
jgi:shikimate kinase